MEPEQQERREKWKAMKPLQPVFSGYSLSSVWLTRLKFAFLRFPYQQITADNGSNR